MREEINKSKSRKANDSEDEKNWTISRLLLYRQPDKPEPTTGIN